MSRTKLYQKIKAIIGQLIGDFVRTIRLKKAVYMNDHEDDLIDVMHSAGIQTHPISQRHLKKEFGKTHHSFCRS